MTTSFPAERVRKDFLEFFRARDHRIVPSAPVFPRDDPTLLFTNAGMNQFKDVFLGTGKRDYKRAADTQKCIRVSGKHNDLEEVGVDTYHHTFFEMLGNWSFGDYFKAEAIPWAWELLTEVWGLPKDRLWVTVFGGDEKDGLPADEEAARIWVEKAGIDPKRVLRFGRKDNFWEMGETGPCGPCTEIHIDRGEPNADRMDGANRKIGVNAGNERFMEIWNNVFIQFNRQDDGKLAELPAKHVDTGMGFERVLSVLQGKRSNYDTDLFAPIFERISSLSKKKYGASAAPADVAFRVIADHARAVTSAISDGALPSNEGRGYVLRRLVRRASRFGRQQLGLEDPFLCEVVPAVAEVLGGTFPEMRQRCEHVQGVIRAEEEQFGKTLGRGLILFEDLAAKVVAQGAKTLPGEAVYDLYATYGFPQDLVELMARERSLGVDLEGWKKAEGAHQKKSRAEGTFKQLLSAEELAKLVSTTSTYHEAGPRSLELETKVLALLETPGAPSRLVLAESPFYAESGGQVGDAGVVESADKSFRFVVEDTRKVGDVVVHLGKATGKPAGPVRARVDRERRDRTRKHHTATHLLHKALQEVLGTHATQQGSYVGPDRLRFDFSHTKAVTPEELERIETIVNERVFANAAVKTTIEVLDEAKARGVVAMFGEKYDERVRVLDVGGWSLELCGGTHVSAAGDIGPFLIVSERAIQAGVRRIEALTGPAAVAEIQRQRRILREAAQALKASPDDVPARLAALQKEAKEAKKQSSASAGGMVAAAFERLRGSLRKSQDVAWVVFDAPELDLDGVRELADRAKTLSPKLIAGLFGRGGGKVPFVIVCQGVGEIPGANAGTLVQQAASVIGGGGGGRPDLAQGQGKDPNKVQELIPVLERAVEALLEGKGASRG
ncbi:MAG: alanine--tRNA ligase [Planctomycetota bacterium]